MLESIDKSLSYRPVIDDEALRILVRDTGKHELVFDPSYSYVPTLED